MVDPRLGSPAGIHLLEPLLRRYCVIAIASSLLRHRHYIIVTRNWAITRVDCVTAYGWPVSRPLCACPPRVPRLPCHMINHSLSISLYYDSSPDTVMYKTCMLVNIMPIRFHLYFWYRMIVLIYHAYRFDMIYIYIYLLSDHMYE